MLFERSISIYLYYDISQTAYVEQWGGSPQEGASFQSPPIEIPSAGSGALLLAYAEMFTTVLQLIHQTKHL